MKHSLISCEILGNAGNSGDSSLFREKAKNLPKIHENNGNSGYPDWPQTKSKETFGNSGYPGKTNMDLKSSDYLEYPNFKICASGDILTETKDNDLIL